MTQVQIYNNNSDIRKQNVCLATIKEARDSRQMRVLAAYFFLKLHFQSNPIIYDYRSRKHVIGDILGVGDRTVHTYIHLWKRWGLVNEHKFNLVLTSIRKVKAWEDERRKYKITISDNETIQTIEARLYAKLLEEHAGTLTWHKRRIRFLYKNTRRAKSGGPNKADRDESPPAAPVSLSYRNAGNVINSSHHKAKEIIAMLNNLGVMYTERNKPRKVCKGTSDDLHAAEGLPGYFYYSKATKCVYQVFGNNHSFVEYPPNNNDMTYKQFMHHYRKGTKDQQIHIERQYILRSTQVLNFQ